MVIDFLLKTCREPHVKFLSSYNFTMSKKITSTIRIASQEDAESIAINHICSWQETYKDFIPESILKNLSVEERTSQWKHLLDQKVKILVIEINKKVIGFASICSFRDAEEKKKEVEGEISAIYLHPSYWRQGLGKKLCQAALSELVNLGFKEVFLWVLSENSQARSFYESLGFKMANDRKLEAFYEGGPLLEEVLYKKS